MATQIRRGAIASTNTQKLPLLSMYGTGGGSPYESPGQPQSCVATCTAFGVTPQIYSSYASDNDTYADIASYGMVSSNATGLRLSLAVSLCTASGHVTDLTTGGSAAANLANFATLAKNICNGTNNGTYNAATAQPRAIIRLGWECNGNEGGGGYPWTQDTTGAQYVAAYQAVVNTMRAQAKITNAANGLGAVSLFVFDWNTNVLSTNSYTFVGDGATAEPSAWPIPWFPAGVDAYGIPYVGLVTCDFYDNGYPEYYINNVKDTITAAANNGTPWALPEWGISGSDNPGFIETIYKLTNGISQNNPATGEPYQGLPAYYQAYFNDYNSILQSVPVIGNVSVTNDSTTIADNIDSQPNYAFFNASVGMAVTGTGIPASSTITTAASGPNYNSVIISNPATESVSPVNVTIAFPNSLAEYTDLFG